MSLLFGESRRARLLSPSRNTRRILFFIRPPGHHSLRLGHHKNPSKIFGGIYDKKSPVKKEKDTSFLPLNSERALG